KFKEDLFTYCVEDLQDTFESSDDNTNVVNAPQEPFVGNQDPGENSSPSPPHIDHCCHECGDSLDGIFCRQCTFGNGTQINVSTPYSSNDSPSVANHPPQPQYVPYSCEVCGNDSHYAQLRLSTSSPVCLQPGPVFQSKL
ncbi:hypothetical protein Tco_0186593, partial [Tanacetum coccineum]